MSQQQLTPVQSAFISLQKSSNDGFKAFVKLFEITGLTPEQAEKMAETEAYYLAQLMATTPALSQVSPGSLMMAVRNIPMMGLSLDPTLKLAYLTVQDKNKGLVTFEPTGRGKAVMAIAQNLVSNISTEVIYSGDEVVRENGLMVVIPKFQESAKVVGGILTVTLPNGRITQSVFNASHINGWQNRSSKRFNGTANSNYTSFNGGIEPGFMESKMLKHGLDRIGINPKGQLRRISPEVIATLPETNEPQVVVEEIEVEHIEVVETPQPEPPKNSKSKAQSIDIEFPF